MFFMLMCLKIPWNCTRARDDEARLRNKELLFGTINAENTLNEFERASYADDMCNKSVH